MKSEEEINKMLEDANQEDDIPTKGRWSMSYEEGVIATLSWVLCVTDKHPLDLIGKK